MKKFGLIGEKLGHTYSPFIHTEILRGLGFECEYNVLEFPREKVPEIVPMLKENNYTGASVTIPYKTDIMPYLDEISEEAAKIGAINTIQFINGKTKGYNTDYFGFGMTMENAGVSVKGKKTLVLGTGGASRAIVQYLSDQGAECVRLATTNPEASKEKFPGYKIYKYTELKDLEDMDIIINCTPVGMFKDKDNTPVEEDILSKFKIAVDIVYNPVETKFLKIAKKIGVKPVGGLYMLVAQAVKSQGIWNNTKIENSVIDDVNEKLLKELENA